jgi:hypothetical protein
MLVEHPLDTGSFDFAMTWSARLGADPAHRWLRELVRAAATAA